MSLKANERISIIIVNYNNAKYLKKSINSALAQNYTPKEVIVIDDKSNDNSLDILKKYKNKIKYFVNKKKTKIGSYNQINSFYSGFKKSRGKYIFFLDSDDYFKIDKIKFVTRQFINQSKENIFFDLPFINKNGDLKKYKFVQKKFILSSWPRFTPQSCIAVERNFAKKIFNFSRVKKFPTLWFDFRIATFCNFKLNKIPVINKHLTYYRQLDNSASSNYKIFSKNWWERRKEAHQFYSYSSKKFKKKDRLTLDRIITHLVCKFL